MSHRSVPPENLSFVPARALSVDSFHETSPRSAVFKDSEEATPRHHTRCERVRARSGTGSLQS